MTREAIEVKERDLRRQDEGSALLNAVVIIIVIMLVAALLFPVFVREHVPARKSTCQSNLKELATAMQMYWNDYNGTLPSSALHLPKGARTWDPRASAEFCMEMGPVPPPGNLKPEDVRWLQVLWPHMKNKDIAWCPSDPSQPEREGWVHRISSAPHKPLSYYYKPAIDRAWFGGCRKETDFDFVADQMLFFEHTGWHWGDQSKGWRDTVTLNAAFMDGHVRNIRLANTAESGVPKTAVGLATAMSEPGEPMWFNYDNRRSSNSSYKGDKNGVYWDPKKYFDMLP